MLAFLRVFAFYIGFATLLTWGLFALGLADSLELPGFEGSRTVAAAPQAVPVSRPEPEAQPKSSMQRDARIIEPPPQPRPEPPVVVEAKPVIAPPPPPIIEAKPVVVAPPSPPPAVVPKAPEPAPAPVAALPTPPPRAEPPAAAPAPVAPAARVPEPVKALPLPPPLPPPTPAPIEARSAAPVPPQVAAPAPVQAPPKAAPPPPTTKSADAAPTPAAPMPPPVQRVAPAPPPAAPKIEAAPAPPVARPAAQARPVQTTSRWAPAHRIAGFGPDGLMDRLEDPRRASDDVACVMMKSVQFRAGTAVLLPRSLSELDTLAEVLKAVPDRRIEIGSKLGPGRPMASDAKLRTDRANLVRENLIELGIAPARLAIDVSENYERVALDVSRLNGGRAQSVGFCVMP